MYVRCSLLIDEKGFGIVFTEFPDGWDTFLMCFFHGLDFKTLYTLQKSNPSQSINFENDAAG